MFESKTVGEQKLRAIIPLEYISHKIYNLFLIFSSGELKRGCFTCQVLTRARSADCIHVLQTGKTQSEQCFKMISKLPDSF